MADITDKLIKQSNGTQPLPTTLSAQKNSGATTASLNAATGWDTTTAKHIRMYKTKVVNGQTVPDWDYVCFYKGTLSGTTLSNLTLVWSSTGSDQTFGIGDTVDLSYTSGYGEDLYSALSTHLDQDGTLKADSVDVTAVIKDAIITRPKLASAFADEIKGGWLSGDLPAVSSVTALGNRSYTVAFASDVSDTLSEGMRIRTTRTVASTQNAFSLDGSNDYYNKTSPSGMTFTDDFSVSAWVYLTAYQAGNVVSRFNGTSGWEFQVTADGRVFLIGRNGSSANWRRVITYQSIPLNKWVHISAQLDMSAHSVAGTTNSYIMIDGVAVPCEAAQNGTNPSTLIQAGNLEVGASAGGTSPFVGYIDQVAIYSAKVPQATHLAAMHQGLTGSETSLISAYSNGSTTDLSATGNNLTAQNGATTVASSPFGNRGLSTTLDYGLVMAVSTTNVTVQVPEGCTIPTSGGVSAVAYSTQASPYGYPGGGNIIGYSQMCSNSSGTTSISKISGFETPVYVPTGRSVRVTLFVQGVYSVTTNNTITLSIWEGTVGSGKSIAQSNIHVNAAGGFPIGTTVTAITKPTTNSVTYNAGIVIASAGTVTMQASSSAPAFLMVELI